jgi:hypothetical protein
VATFEVEPQGLTIPAYESRNPNYISLATVEDFDHDGKADIGILANYPPAGTEVYDGPAVIFIYYGNSDGTFASPVTAAVLHRLYLNFFASDLNGDGLLDFVLNTVGSNSMYSDYEGTAISIVHSLPGRKFSTETNLIAGEGFASVAVADFNRDGQAGSALYQRRAGRLPRFASQCRNAGHDPGQQRESECRRPANHHHRHDQRTCKSGRALPSRNHHLPGAS